MKTVQSIALLFMLMISSCTLSKKITSWKVKNVSSQNYTKILVLGFTRDADVSIKENIETQLTDDLQKKGLSAVSSLNVYGTKVFDRMDEDDALYQLNNSCVDAVLTVTLLNSKKESKYVPGNSLYTPFSYYYERFWRYRTTLFHRIYEPGYYDSGRTYFWECNLYDMKTQKLIYSVHTKSFDISDFNRTYAGCSRVIIKDLIKKIF